MDDMEPNPQHGTAGAAIRRRRSDQTATGTRNSTNPIEATVTKLLVATKQLLEGLTLWSTRKMTEEQVSDIFVQLATQFNLASQAFHSVGIDTSELAQIPDDLRNCLETALGEVPSPSSLDLYLPRIKEIIINLLQGLRLKQNLYREQHEARTTRLQGASGASSRSKSGGANYRPGGTRRSPEVDGGTRHQPTDVGSTPTVSVAAPHDEQGHEETMASLRTDALTRRASSRRQSHRFSTLMEQNAPPVPRRILLNDGFLAAYPGNPGYLGSPGSTPATSPNAPISYGQFPTMPVYEPPSSTLSSSTTNHSLEVVPQPPTIPVPPPLPFQQTVPSPMTSPQLGSSMMVNSLGSEAAFPPRPSIKSNESSETVHSLATFTASNAAGDSSVTPIPTAETEGISLQTVEPQETSLTLFLQVGKSVKKTTFEGELTHSGLRMLFMEKFQYNPGQEDFPTIYVKDPNTNIHYELESLADVRQNAFLSLNVDDLENIQRKMDQGFAVLSKELQDLRKVQEAAESARQKAAATAAAAAAAATTANSSAERNTGSSPESSQMLRSVVSKVLARNKAAAGSAAQAAQAAQDKVNVEQLKAHYDQVQTLRRDLSVVRQMYTELQSETKTILGNLATATNQARKQATDQPTSSRIFIESGKVKLDKMSEDLTNKIEDLQDIVEDMKTNVTQRRGRPSDSSLAFASKQCEEIGKEIEELSDFIQTQRPIWKKTWEVELQTIVKEQMFLKEQEALLEDLKEDRGSLVQTLGNLNKVLELQLKSTGGGREFVYHPPVDDNFEGLKTVMEEVKMVEPDSDKRLRAMAQMEKIRQIELSNRIDEFEDELSSFVGASKLRKTGGALEAERLRQQRDLENLKAMFPKKDASLPSPTSTATSELAPEPGVEAPTGGSAAAF
ncbi:Bud site selection protein 6 [Mortierella sp. NVP85]|nr:Bud site selection protein 6 [Mortierella sp. NVP85]